MADCGYTCGDIGPVSAIGGGGGGGMESPCGGGGAPFEYVAGEMGDPGPYGMGGGMPAGNAPCAGESISDAERECIIGCWGGPAGGNGGGAPWVAD
jgi:hypothetical protein